MRLSIASLILLTSLHAGQTGKISGHVTDNDTGNDLIGVNIIIEELGTGASTDIDGYYTILNVPPGTYTLRSSMIGYTTIITENVRVAMDQTTRLDLELITTVLGMEAVTVVSTRPVIERDISASQLNVDAETISQMPVIDVQQIVGQQAGVEGLSVRGGAHQQTAFYLDGFLMNDTRSYVPISSVSLSAISEIQIQSGGFNAEYGNMRSGVINVITNEGSTEGYNGSISYRYSAPAQKNYGLSPYDENSYYLRPYLDDAVAWVGTYDGDWDDYTRTQYPAFDGWNAYSETTMSDDDPSNDLTPAAAQREFLFRHRRNGEIAIPDYTVDLGFGGPVPMLADLMGNLRFHLSHRGTQTAFVVPLSRDAYMIGTTRLKLSADMTSNMKLTATYQYSQERSVIPYSWKTTPTGGYLDESYEVANLVSGGSNVLFKPGYYSPTSIYRTMVGLKMNHMLSEKTFYEVILQQMQNRYNSFETELRDTTLIEIIPDYYVDEYPFGYDGDEWMNLGRDKTTIRTTIVKGDFTSQVTRHHQIKTGAQLMYNDYRVRSFMESNKDTWSRSLVYNVYPYLFSLYIQDKLEFEGFVANLGLRGEYSQSNTDLYLLDAYDPDLTSGAGADLETNAETVPTKGTWTLSPRLGISHPITNRSKLFFNYGHFYSEPASSYRFRIQREYSGLVTHIGNPDLELERTIAYELGYDQSIWDNVLLKVATYYKDVTNQPNWVAFTSADGSVNYVKAENNNYEDIRGIELTMSKGHGTWWSGFVNYTYQVESEGYFGLRHHYQDPQKQRDYILRYPPAQVKPLPRPYFRLNLVLHSPARFGPKVLDRHPLGNWQASFLGNWKAGQYSTWNPNEIPGLSANVRWVDSVNVDLRFSKSIQLRGSEFEIFADIENLLDTKYLSYAGFSGIRDFESYMYSLNFDFEEGVEKGNDRIGTYRPDDVDYDPLEANPYDDPDIAAANKRRKETKSYIDNPDIRSMTFLDPRKINIGIRLNF